MENKKLELLSTYLVPSLISLYKNIVDIPIFAEGGSKTNQKLPYMVISQENRELHKSKDGLYQVDYIINFSVYGKSRAECLVNYIQIIDLFNRKNLFEKEEIYFFDNNFYLIDLLENEGVNFQDIEEKNFTKLDFSFVYVLGVNVLGEKQD